MKSDLKFKVKYPYTGIHYLYQWYTRDEGNHIVLAKSLESANYVLSRVLDMRYDSQNFYKADKYDSLEVILGFKINIIVPSLSIQQLYIDQEYNQNVSIFRQFCRYSLMNASSKLNLSEFFDISYYKDDPLCIDDLIPKNCSWEELFDIFGSQFIKVEKNSGYLLKEEPSDCDELMVCSTNFGHHCNGIGVSDFNPENINLSTLFFFERISSLSILEFNEKIAFKKEENRLRFKSELEERKKIRLQEEKVNFLKLKSILDYIKDKQK